MAITEREKLEKKMVSGIMLALLLISMLTLAFNVQSVRAEETIYIRPDGTVYPSTAPLSRVGDVYTFTSNIYDLIVVQRSNIIIDGAGCTLQGSGSGNGFYLYSIKNVTIQNTNIQGFNYGVYIANSFYSSIAGNNITENNWYGIWLQASSNNNISRNNITKNDAEGFRLYYSSYNSISENTIANNSEGIGLYYSLYNSISRNNMTTNDGVGIWLGYSSNNSISGNNMTANNMEGIVLVSSSNNNITGNTIANNRYGILLDSSSNNFIYHNNFVNNVIQVLTYRGSVDVWDNGYPSAGNYWSDYIGVDQKSGPNQDQHGSDGIGDTPYVIDADNRDRYPLMMPWTPIPPIITATLDIDPDTLNLRSKGKWIIAYIQLSKGYNPEEIDATTILLNETIQPVLDPKYDFVTNSSEYLVDHNNDGIIERMVKFNRTEVESFISSQGIGWGKVPLTVTGELFDGTSFEGTDIIFVFYGGAGGRRK